MSLVIIIITLITLLITHTHSQINCTNATEANTTAGNKLLIHAALCPSDNMIYMDITYTEYNNNYFGIVFSRTMVGDSLVYTTGKSNDRPEALYAYKMTEYNDSDVIYQPNDNWEEESTTITNNSIRVIYRKPLADTPWDLDTPIIQFGYAIGDSLTLNKHTETSVIAQPYELVFSETAPPTTTDSSSKGCNKQDLVAATATWDEFDAEITLFINCSDNTVTVSIKYSSYNNNWFGIVFSKNMLGNALIYTTGTSTVLNEGLYPYTIAGYNIGQITYDGSENNWIKNKADDENGVFIVEYKQSLAKTPFTRETEIVPVRWAKGNSLILSKHESPAGRSDKIKYFYLLTGEVRTVSDDFSLERAHGIIMWITWAILASIGIMSSSFKYLYPNGPSWFLVHRGVQILVVILNIIGFIIAIIFTQNKGKPHFNNSHMIIGLVVTILAVSEPFNALCRPNPMRNNKKPMSRKVWELIHKMCGFGGWILGCVAAMLGLQLLGDELLAYVHMFGWCGLLLVGYIVLFGIGWRKENLKKQMNSVNEDIGGSEGDAIAREKLVAIESP